MTLPLYFDHHVDAAVAAGLRRRGIDVLTAYQDGRADAADEDILRRATQLGRVTFTQDDDFLAIADQWQREGTSFAGVIYAHQLRVTIGQIIDDLELIVSAMSAEELQQCVLFLPL